MHTIRSAWTIRNTPAIDSLDVMVFLLGEQEYGVDLAKVQELRSYDPVQRLPGVPQLVRGAIDLLGTPVPLLDMRIALGFDTPVTGDFCDVIIFHIGGRQVSAAVDDVVDVVTLSPDQISPPPATGARIHADNLIGIATLPGRNLILIDIDNFMRAEAFSVLDELAA